MFPSVIVLAALICQEDTAKNQCTSCVSHCGHRFLEEKGTADDRGYRNQIDIIGTSDGSQFVDRDAPHRKADKRGHQTKEKDVEKH